MMMAATSSARGITARGLIEIHWLDGCTSYSPGDEAVMDAIVVAEDGIQA
jgi:hypothetical protein